MIKLVLYDPREDPRRKERSRILHRHAPPLLVQVPHGIYHGWKCISEEEAIIVNVPTRSITTVHRTNTASSHGTDVPYDWSRKDG